MASPLSADRLLAALRAEGVNVIEYGNWRSHNRNHKGAFGPVNGVMIHHTVSSGTDSSVRLCYDGYSELPGPLCHGVIAKNGAVYLTSSGRANHAGKGDSDVLRAVVAERALPATTDNDTDGNSHFYGFECINLGDGDDPWPEAQLDAIERVGAAICRAYGWSAASVIGHKEWTNTKIDPRGFSMGDMRARIERRLGGKPQPKPDGGSSGTSYTVKAGDTLSAVGRAHGVPWKEIAAANGIGAPYTIKPGQRLTLPGTSGPRFEPFPGADWFKNAPHSPIVTAMGRRLVEVGCSAYGSGPGPQWTTADRESFRQWQMHLGDDPEYCDGWPGRRQWDALKVPKV
ncbi:N-acetylmuramoyl-L-alanine amidase [Streptomyces sp. NBRC 110611]|uniref:peptidoglycan-binding protein n=1 Tax=Streptomyces sp. NBRC 110611 TaxID=1621259 RepID=UPI000836819B|nr:peptidoglycan-binding protein [Streptomyces sp. NBRC 110611]GAU67696.1 N-acetylmuramoyl-L-alanine amidase [Streptomyces sp. NBRC 110611]